MTYRVYTTNNFGDTYVIYTITAKDKTAAYLKVYLNLPDGKWVITEVTEATEAKEVTEEENN